MSTRDLHTQGMHRAHLGGLVTERQEEDGSRVFTFVASTEKPARDGHILLQNWDLRAFEANRVILYAHDHDTVIGRASRIYVEQSEQGRQLVVEIRESDLDTENPSERVRSAVHQVRQGFLRAVSIGWITHSAKRRGSYPSDSPYYEEDSWGYVIGEEEPSELLEVSIVSVPADAEALARAAAPRQLTEKEIRALVRDELQNGQPQQGFPAGFFDSTP